MTGETRLQTLLSEMNPELADGEFVFCQLQPQLMDGLDIEPIGQFLEREGWTLILARSQAQAKGLEFSYPCRMIVLQIHSSLDAVGFLAAITTRLAEAGISVNAISAYHHDYLFVPVDRADEALTILRGVAANST